MHGVIMKIEKGLLINSIPPPTLFLIYVNTSAALGRVLWLSIGLKLPSPAARYMLLLADFKQIAVDLCLWTFLLSNVLDLVEWISSCYIFHREKDKHRDADMLNSTVFHL